MPAIKGFCSITSILCHFTVYVTKIKLFNVLAQLFLMVIFRDQCEEYLKELEVMLNKEKDTRVKKLKEDCEMYFKEQEKKVIVEKAQFEEEIKQKIQDSSSQ